jgi:hypothetical protein
MTSQPATTPKTKSTPAASESPKTKLAKLLEQRQQLDAQIKAQQVREAKEKRQRETREKILIGAAIQKQISKGALTPDWLRAVLEAELTLERDRKLFHLPPLPETAAEIKEAG